MELNEKTSDYPSEWRQFWSFTMSNPRVPTMVWFYGILLKALTLMWLGYGAARGMVVLSEHGPPEAFLMVLLQVLAATVLYFLGDGLCNGERTAVYGLASLGAVSVIIAIWAHSMGYNFEMGMLLAAILFLFTPPVVSGLRNLKLLE